MKLKEYPPSLRMMWRLKRLPEALLYRRPDPETDLPLVVSLTSIPSRLGVVHLTLRSLLNQTMLPHKIVLWLHESLADRLPPALSRLQSERLEIRYGDQTCSHRKLVYPLQQFPENTVVTVDDDVMYHPDCIAALYQDHLTHPRDVIAHECRVITHERGELAPYRSWPWESPGQTHEGTLPIGFGGTLYPPGCLHPETTHSDLYLELAPRSDDMWFKVMALRAGTAARRCSRPCPRPQPIPFSQKVSLQKSNVRRQGNVEQWQRLSRHFQLK